MDRDWFSWMIVSLGWFSMMIAVAIVAPSIPLALSAAIPGAMAIVSAAMMLAKRRQLHRFAQLKNSLITSVALFDGQLYAAGVFTHALEDTPMIVRWDPKSYTWRPVGFMTANEILTAERSHDDPGAGAAVPA